MAPSVLLLCSISISLYRGDTESLPPLARLARINRDVAANTRQRIRFIEANMLGIRTRGCHFPPAFPSPYLPCGLPAFVAAIGKT